MTIYTSDSPNPKRYGIIVEFESENGLDMELILGEVESAVINSAPHVFNVTTSSMEGDEI